MDLNKIRKELSFKAIRSSGPGGQHVNKVSSKVELTFDLNHSEVLTVEQKEALIKNLASKLTKNNVLILQCDESRSQHKNKEIVMNRFLDLIVTGLIKPKQRKISKPSKAAIQKRLISKKKLSDKKSGRKKLDF